jgi:hypothetical protein
MASGITTGISFAVGVSLVGISLFLSWLSTNYGFNMDLLKWLLLPTLGYLVALGLNMFLQQVSCGKSSITQIAIASSPIPIAILFFLLITLIGFVRAPIESAVPLAYRTQYGQSMALAFYMFWAGMFGEGLAGGFAQGCPA